MGILYNASQEVRLWIKEQPVVKEESITDWMLWDISKYAKNVHYYMFNRLQEATNGADWLWCFKRDSYLYLFLVQAKKAKRTASANREGLDQHHGDQIKNLLISAHSQGFFLIYSIYSYSNCKTLCCMPKRNEGVFLVNAYTVKSLYDKKKTSTSQLLNTAIGLSCLEDCPLSYCPCGGTAGFEYFLSHCFSTSIRIYHSDNHRPQETVCDVPAIYRYTMDNIPPYIQQLPVFQANHQMDTLPTWYEKEFCRSLGNLHGIIVFDWGE